MGMIIISLGLIVLIGWLLWTYGIKGKKNNERISLLEHIVSIVLALLEICGFFFVNYPLFSSGEDNPNSQTDSGGSSYASVSSTVSKLNKSSSSQIEIDSSALLSSESENPNNSALSKATPAPTSNKTSSAEIIISLDAEGGVCSKESITVPVSETYGTLPTPVREYYTFDGWFTSESGGDRITPSSVVQNSSTQILYAHWTKNQESEWTLRTSIPAEAQITNQKWSYCEGKWVDSNPMEKKYAAFSDGFDKNHPLYSYSDSAFTATTKPENPVDGMRYQTVENVHNSWIYWHWCYSVNKNGDAVIGGPYNCLIEEYSGWNSTEKLNFDTFHAFESTESFGSHNGNNIDFENINTSICDRTWWWHRIEVFQSICTTHTYEVTSKESALPVTNGGNISNVQEWVKYIPK